MGNLLLYIPLRRRAPALAYALLLLILLAQPSMAAGARAGLVLEEAAPTGPAASCAGVTALPEAECETLVQLYQQTGGPNWTVDTDWLTFSATISPCDWFGVTCAPGRGVTELALPANGLAGSIPGGLADFASLTRLDLSNNAIETTIPRAFCRLADTLTALELDYNKIEAAGNRARACLDAIAPGWHMTQTLPPADFTAAATNPTSVRLSWTPIAYQADGGGYMVAISESFGGPYTPAGQTADKSASGLDLTGLAPGRTYYVRLRAMTPAHGEQTNQLVSDFVAAAVATESSQRVLLVLFFAADNDLSVYVDPLLHRVADGTVLNPNVQVVALVDRAGDHNSEVWFVAGGTARQSTEFLDQWGSDEVDTADPALLSAFLRYARTKVPAQRTLVSLMGHGVGLAPDLAWLPPAVPGEPPATPRPGIPALPREKDATPTDITSGSYMSTPALGQALADATDDGANPFDLVFFDQCFAGNLDILYEVREAAAVFIASPNYAWFSAPYSRYMPEFSPSRTPEQMAQAVISVYQRSLSNAHPNAIFWLRSQDIESVAGAVDDLAGALVDALDGDRAATILAAAQAAKYVDTTQCGRQNLQLGPPDELLGANSFANALKDGFGAGDAYGVSAAVDGLLAALSNVQGNARVGNPYLDPEVTWDYDDTLTLLAPLRRDAPAGLAWRASLYRSDVVGREARWMADPSQTVIINRGFGYVQDGRWDEFIAAWYGDHLQPTVGEWCSYTPPPLVVADEVEETDLTVTVGNTVHLVWSTPEDDTPVTYAIYVRRPRDVSWTLHALVDAPQTELTLAGVEGGAYRFLVAALNADEVHFARTNAVDMTVPDPATRVFLPHVVNR